MRDLHERLAHGRQLKIYLSKSADKLEFTPTNDPGRVSVYWEKGGLRWGPRLGLKRVFPTLLLFFYHDPYACFSIGQSKEGCPGQEATGAGTSTR